jgi:hypothetical protein
MINRLRLFCSNCFSFLMPLTAANR